MSIINKTQKRNKMKNYKTIIQIVPLLLLAVVLLFSCSDEKKCEYVLDEDTGFPFPCEKGMDIAFLVDYTGSMSGAIESVKSSVNKITDSINNLSSGDYRLSLSLFDEGVSDKKPLYYEQSVYQELPSSQKEIISNPSSDRVQYLTVMEKFSNSNSATFKQQLYKINSTNMAMGNGAGFPEPGGLLLSRIIDEDNPFAGAWRDGITKFAIIITDAPAGGYDDKADAIDDQFLEELAIKANKQGIQCILVSSVNPEKPTVSNYELHLIDKNNCGKKFIVRSFDGVGKKIIEILKDVCDNPCTEK